MDERFDAVKSRIRAHGRTVETESLIYRKRRPRVPRATLMQMFCGRCDTRSARFGGRIARNDLIGNHLARSIQSQYISGSIADVCICKRVGDCSIIETHYAFNPMK